MAPKTDPLVLVLVPYCSIIRSQGCAVLKWIFDTSTGTVVQLLPTSQAPNALQLYPLSVVAVQSRPHPLQSICLSWQLAQ